MIVHLIPLSFSYSKIYGGDGVSRPSINGALSNDTRVYFNDTNRFSSDLTSFFTKSLIVFVDSTNQGLSAEITGVSLDGTGKIEYVDINAIWTPVDASKQYVIISFYDEFTDVTEENKVYDISNIVASVRCDTNISYGFSVCNIDIDMSRSDSSKIFARTNGFLCRVFMNDGVKIWEGLVTKTSINGFGGSIEAQGFGYTSNWFMASSIYPGNDRNVTTTKVLREQAIYNPYFVKTEIDGLDRIGCLFSGQLLDMSFPGWGPIDFEETPSSISDAFDAVLRYGGFPGNTGNGVAFDYNTVSNPFGYTKNNKDYIYPGDDAFVHVWFDRIPVTYFARRDPGLTDYDWIIDDSNMLSDMEGVSIESSFEDVITVKRSTYKLSDGETVNTQPAVKWPAVEWFGHMEERTTSGSLSQAENLSVLAEAVTSPKILTKPGSITITGKARRGNGPFRQSIALIRAGDIVFLQTSRSGLIPQENEFALGGKFIVGSTSYNSDSDTMSLTVYTNTDLIERQVTIMNVSTS